MESPRSVRTIARWARPLLVALVLSVGARERKAAEPPRAAPQPVLSGMDGEEHFALELRVPGDAPGRGAVSRPVGVARLKRSFGAPTQLELEARFFDEPIRVHHIERVGEGERELVWREWRAAQGRTLHVRLADGRLDVVEWGRAQALRASFGAPEGLLFPLQAVELARLRGGLEAWGAAPASSWDPLGRRVETLRVRCEVVARAAGDSGPERRSVRFTAEDGSAAGEFTFVGSQLLAFRWQAGDLTGRAIDGADYERRIREHESSLVER